MEVDAVSWKGKGKEKSGKGKMGGKKGKEILSGKGYGEMTTEHSRFGGECRNCGKYGHKAPDCWYKQTTKSQGKGRGTGTSKSKMTEICDSDSSKQVEETWTSNTSASECEWMRRWTLDILAGRQQETSVHGELGRSVWLDD